MPELTFDLDLGTYNRDVKAELERFDKELSDASFDAALDGVEEMQSNHPYTDRTYQLTERAVARRAANGEAAMEWRKAYASFVDQGTSRAKAYPFTPQATQRAQASLERRAERATEALVAKFSR